MTKQKDIVIELGELCVKDPPVGEVVLYQRCTRCVMDTTDKDIVFDENGVCNHCRRYEKAASSLVRRPLHDIGSEIRDRKRINTVYDAVLGISGGADSSYAAYLARDLGLNPLLVHVDDGWDTPEAKHNIRVIKEATGFDLICYYVNTREYLDIQLAYLRAGVVGLEAPTDNAIEAILHLIVLTLGVRTIISGGNWATEGIMPAAWGYHNNDSVNIRDIHRKYGTMKLEHFKTLGILRKYWRIKIGGWRVYRFLNHVDYRREEIITKLTREWGWKPYGRKHQENVFTRFVESHIFPLKHGFDKRLAHYSSYIMNEGMNREEAVRLLTEPIYGLEEFKSDYNFFLERLGLTVAEFGEIMSSPVKSHYDFKTHKRRLWMLRQARRLIGG